MQDARIFLESLFAAQQACNMLFTIIENTEAELDRLGVSVPDLSKTLPCV
jgi:hypothetical protein